MSASNAVYVNTSNASSSPLSSQHDFSQNYDMDSPVAAARSYARSMHMHTKKQMEAASRSSRRRGAEAGDAMRSLDNEESQDSNRSVSSMDSDRS